MFKGESDSSKIIDDSVKLVVRENTPIIYQLVIREITFLAELYGFKRYDAYHPAFTTTNRKQKKIAYPKPLSVDKCVWDAYNEHRLAGKNTEGISAGREILKKARSYASVYGIDVKNFPMALKRCRYYHSDLAVKIYLDYEGKEIGNKDDLDKIKNRIIPKDEIAKKLLGLIKTFDGNNPVMLADGAMGSIEFVPSDGSKRIKVRVAEGKSAASFKLIPLTSLISVGGGAFREFGSPDEPNDSDVTVQKNLAKDYLARKRNKK